MRPRRLVIEHFGPYADVVEIDFDELAEEGLFLIHGTTGAGKTYLLDAMSYALYGKVPGDRTEGTLRSHFAEPGAVARVTLEFTVSSGRYRVTRTPRQEVAKQRGTGSTTKQPSASLVHLGDPVDAPVASAVKEVNAEIERLVGLGSEQFMQVVLLPQGKFEQVLRAKSDAREALLKSLFDTSLYEYMSWWLDEQARAKNLEVDERQRVLDEHRRRAFDTWNTLRSDHDRATDAGDVPADQAGVDALVESVGAIVEARRNQEKAARQTKKAASDAQRTTKEKADRWDRRDTAQGRLGELEKEREAIDAARADREIAEEAERLRASIDAADEHRRQHQAFLEDVVEDLAAARTACDDAPSLPSAITSLDLTELPTADAITTAIAELGAHRARVDELVRKQTDADTFASQAGEQEVEADRHRGIAKHLLERSEELTGKRDEVQAQIETARTARDQLGGLRQAAIAAKEKAEAAAELATVRKKVAAAEKEARKLERQANDAGKLANDLRERYLGGIAATLAGKLVPGEACAVCGSTDHPAKAQPAADAVTRAEVDQAAEDADGARKAADAADEKARELATKAVGLETKAGDAADEPKAAAAEAEAAGREADEADIAAQGLSGLETGLAQLEADIKKAGEDAAAAGKAEATAAQAAKSLVERADKLRKEIVDELGEGVMPGAVVGSLEVVGKAIEKVRSCAEAKTAKVAALKGATERLERELAASSFPDEAAARAALRSDDDRAELAKRITTYDDELTKQRGVLGAPDLRDLPDERPDTEAADEAAGEADLAYTAAVAETKSATDAQKEIERLADLHRADDATLGADRQRAELLNAVANRCAGKTAPKISLQRWVLSAFLAEICRYANQRLQIMSAGRFHLRVTDEEGHKGQKAGLGLRVLDTHTGSDREVNTMSGGETFLASLALALGVADVVSARAGGVQIDALFVDEGFGTLDADKLQLAMDELDRLREGGRMVGIISHVRELRERIRMGIEVTATDKGSFVRVGATAAP